MEQRARVNGKKRAETVAKEEKQRLRRDQDKKRRKYRPQERETEFKNTLTVFGRATGGQRQGRRNGVWLAEAFGERQYQKIRYYITL